MQLPQGLKADDIVELFEMLDVDGGGTLDIAESAAPC